MASYDNVNRNVPRADTRGAGDLNADQINQLERTYRTAEENAIRILAGRNIGNDYIVGNAARVDQNNLESRIPELSALLGDPANGEVVLSYPDSFFEEDINHMMLFQMYEREDESERILNREVQILQDRGEIWGDLLNRAYALTEGTVTGHQSEFSDTSSVGGMRKSDVLSDDELSRANSNLEEIKAIYGIDGQGVDSRIGQPERRIEDAIDGEVLRTRNRNPALARAGRRGDAKRFSRKFKQDFQDRSMSQAPKYKSKQSIFLYMPSTINETNIQSYDTPELLLANFASDTLQKFKQGDGFTDSLGSAVKNVIDNAAAIGGRKLAGFADSLAAILGLDLNSQQAIQAITGLSINPRREQVYQSPDFRTFSYTYEFYPRSERETQQVNSIIRFFKYHSYPDLDPTGNLYVAPAIFKIKYLYRDAGAGLTENIWLNRIKNCVLSEVQVDYTAPGKFTTHADGSPVGIKLSLTFREIEHVVKQDILEGA